MSFTCSTDGQSPGVVNQGAHTTTWTLYGSYSVPFLGPHAFAAFEYGLASVFEGGTGAQDLPTPPNYASFSSPVTLLADRNYVFRATVFQDGAGTARGSILGFKSYAVTATASAPTSRVDTAHTANVGCDFFPNTDASVASVKMQYRRFGDQIWIDAPGGSTNYSGYSMQNISRDLTGLTGSTTYQYKMVMSRTTANDTTLESSIPAFTTIADVPSITTGVATNIGTTVTTLNGTVNPNGVSCTFYFEWGPTAAYGNTTPAQGPNSGSSPMNFSAQVTGLSPSSTYHFRAVAFV